MVNQGWIRVLKNKPVFVAKVLVFYFVIYADGCMIIIILLCKDCVLPLQTTSLRNIWDKCVNNLTSRSHVWTSLDVVSSPCSCDSNTRVSGRIGEIVFVAVLLFLLNLAIVWSHLIIVLALHHRDFLKRNPESKKQSIYNAPSVLERVRIRHSW